VVERQIGDENSKLLRVRQHMNASQSPILDPLHHSSSTLSPARPSTTSPLPDMLEFGSHASLCDACDSLCFTFLIVLNRYISSIASLSVTSLDRISTFCTIFHVTAFAKSNK